MFLRKNIFPKAILATLYLISLHGCSDQANSLPTIPQPPAPPLVIQTLTGFDMVSETLWDETAVRKVLDTFAYGGHATDSQITQWANLRPDMAIVEMLTFEQHNTLLSPSNDALSNKSGTLMDLAQFWASDDPDNNTPHKDRYDLFGGGQVQIIWTKAATTRGLNPFRQKIGLWETNYHLATNLTVVPRRVMAPYYDAILTAHEQKLPYQAVMAEAAKSAAIAIQYGHRKNVFVDDLCLCNEDFAREYHQLFFGILGTDNPDYHESISIKDTAFALTDMEVSLDLTFGGFSNVITYGTEKHTPGSLEILHASIGGNNASQRIDQLSDFAIAHPESLKNLPVKIINGLADDNLTEEKINRIQMAWQSMSEKNLLNFLHAYATSTLFHDNSRFKYRTSIDRNILIVNKILLNNTASDLDIYTPLDGYEGEGVRAFHPSHNVFGGQSGEESINSSATFQNNFKRVTEQSWRFAQSQRSEFSLTWNKDWASVIPQSTNGYIVKDVTEWLWQRFVSDGLKNLGTLERAHLYALLGSDTDLAYHINSEDKDRVISALDIQTDPNISSAVNDLSQQTLAIGSSDTTQREDANHRIGQAINFIVGSPYLFAEEGR